MLAETLLRVQYAPMSLDIQKLHDELKIGDFANARERCCASFGCDARSIDDLFSCMTENGFFEVCRALAQIQEASAGVKQALETGLILVIEKDLPSTAKRDRALQAARGIWSAFSPP